MKLGLIQKLTTDTNLLKRLIILVSLLLVVAIFGFGAYYYYDRYYSSKPKAMDLTIQKAEQALVLDPKNADKRLDLAQAYLVNNQYVDAISNASQVLLENPEHQRAWLLLGMGYAMKGDPSSAIQPLQKYFDANKNTSMPGLNKTLQTAAFYLGDSYYKMGQPENALEPLESDVKWSKTDADAMCKLGLVYIELKKYSDALNMFAFATAFVPNYLEAYEGMAKIFTLTNEPDFVNYAQGMVAYSKEDYPTAISLLLKASQAKPDFSPVFAGLGMAYEAQADYLKSRDAFDAALKLDQTNLTAQQGRQRVEIIINKK
jgi:tetratricopeptide (TPR) repeat protein